MKKKNSKEPKLVRYNVTYHFQQYAVTGVMAESPEQALQKVKEHAAREHRDSVVIDSVCQEDKFPNSQS